MNTKMILALSLLLVGGSLLAVLGGKSEKLGLTSAFAYVHNTAKKPVILRAGYFPEDTGKILPPMPGKAKPFIDQKVKPGEMAQIAYHDNNLGMLKYIDVVHANGKTSNLIPDASKATFYEITEKNGVWSVKQPHIHAL